MIIPGEVVVYRHSFIEVVVYRYFELLTEYNTSPYRMYWEGTMGLERATWMTVHLLRLNSMSHSNDHFANLSRSSWSI